MKRDERNIDEILKRHLPSASSQEIEAGGARVLDQLRRGNARSIDDSVSASVAAPVFYAWPRMAMAAAAVILVVFAGLWMTRVQDPFYRVVEGAAIESAGAVRTDETQGAVLALTDGSHIEMRSSSELALENAQDGVRIRLTRGGVIVTAASQRGGHLYVQTRDMTVSVVGTVFLVNADETGSRVAVIEGEVQVELGATSQNLLPGDQVATNPSMEPHPMAEEISWSPHAEAHLALLERSMAPRDERAARRRLPAADPVDASESFEVVTITRGGPAAVACSALEPIQNRPRRFALNNATLNGILAMAYGASCPAISGGPDWAKSETFNIDALMPEGAPSFTTTQIREGDAQRLQGMLRTMLAERFNLAVHRERRDMAAYELLLVKEGRNIRPAEDQNPAAGAVLPRFLQRRCPCPPSFVGAAFSMSRLANALSEIAGRPVLDRTNLSGRFDLRVDYVVDNAAADPIEAQRTALFHAMEDQLGLRLEAARIPVEVLVIDHAERPTDH